MAKPEISVRFNLIVHDVDASELGKVVALLSSIGQTKLTHE